MSRLYTEAAFRQVFFDGIDLGFAIAELPPEERFSLLTQEFLNDFFAGQAQAFALPQDRPRVQVVRRVRTRKPQRNDVL
jgi:hypothetical protein